MAGHRRPAACQPFREAAVRAALSGLRATGEVHQISLPFADALSAMRSLKASAPPICTGADRRPLGRGKLRELQLAPQRQGICPLTYSLLQESLSVTKRFCHRDRY